MGGMADETDRESTDQAGGTLADAIAAHLELKREHGADPEAIESELEEALSPPRREQEDEPAAQVETAEQTIQDQPAEEEAAEAESAEEQAAEAQADPVQEAPSGTEPSPEQALPESDLPSEEPDAPAPGEITGTIEFEFGAGQSPAQTQTEQPQQPAAVDEHDLLEDTPEFFEETPEHDKLWFDEAPPRKFDF